MQSFVLLGESTHYYVDTLIKFQQLQKGDMEIIVSVILL